MFERGKTYNRRTDIHAPYGGNAQSGIAPCANHPYVFLFTAPAGEQYGYQDAWLSATQFSYTGEGQLGNMEMARGNRAIQRHADDSRELHLFEKTDRSGHYRYLGQFRYVSHQVRRGNDADGDDRSQIVFTLELVEPPASGSAQQARPARPVSLVADGEAVAVDACDSRTDTIVTGCVAAASVALFAAVYGPVMASAAPGSGIAPGMNVLSLLAFMFGYGWWVMCVAYGVRQLFVRPRRYGLFTIGFGALQLAAIRLIEWLLMDSRGVYWATC